MSEAQQKIEHGNDEPEKLDDASTIETETDAPERPQETNQTSANNKGKGMAGFIAFVALIIAIGAFAAGYQVWTQIGTQQASLDQRLADTEKSIASIESGSESSRSIAETVQGSNQLMQTRMDSIESKLGSLDEKVTSSINSFDEQLRGDINSFDEKLSGSIAKLEESDDAIGESIGKLNEALRANTNDDMLVAEARYLITLANHQAQLSQNPAAAAAALNAANQRLSDAADPSLLAARQILTDNIIALRNVASLDISSIALTLSQLEKNVDGLPLKTETPTDTTPATEDTPEEASFADKVWGDIKGLVSIRRNSDTTSVALLPPGQRFFLVQNLRLKLEAARLALLQRDTPVFHDSLKTVEQWLDAYFDTSATSSANLLSTIKPYQSLELAPTMPDISKSLKALDEWSNKQQDATISYQSNAEEVSAS